VRLPAVIAPAADPSADVAARSAPSLAGTVVVVEDDAVIRALIGDILRKAGFAVLEAQDGTEALAMCRAHPDGIDLVLSDVVMPRMSGDELSERLAAERSRARIVYMSGYPDRSVPGGRNDGTAPVLLKPFTPAQLLDWIRAAMR
jgi:CheY-like chemotaxis protein